MCLLHYNRTPAGNVRCIKHFIQTNQHPDNVGRIWKGGCKMGGFGGCGKDSDSNAFFLFLILLLLIASMFWF